MAADIITVLARWLHVGPVIIAIGGACFIRFVLMPCAHESLDGEQWQRLQAAVKPRWRKFVHMCIALILITGLYNVFRTFADKTVLYHALFGLKLLAALGVFFIASALVGESAALSPIRARAGRWLALLILLAALIVAISGVLRNLPDKPASDPAGALRLTPGSEVT